MEKPRSNITNVGRAKTGRVPRARRKRERKRNNLSTLLQYEKKKEERVKETFTGALAGGFEMAPVNNGSEQAHSLVDGGLGVFHGEVYVVPLPRHCPTTHPLHFSSPINNKGKEVKKRVLLLELYPLSTNKTYKYLSMLNGL